MADDDEITEGETAPGSTSFWEYPKTPIQIQLETCTCVLITPIISGMVILREKSIRKLYLPTTSKAIVDFAPAAGDLFGAFLSGFLLYYLGRKINIIIINILFLLPLLLFVADLEPKHEFAGIVILYFAHRFLVVTLHVYVAEVTEPKLRALFLGLFFVGYTLGNLAGNSLPPNSKVPILAGFVFTITALVRAFLSPESPYYLALHNRREEAEEVFERLRGSTDETTEEATVLFDKAEAEGEQQQETLLIWILYRRQFIVPLVIVFFMLLANNEMCFVIKPTLIEILTDPKKIDVEPEITTEFMLEYTLPILGSILYLGMSLVLGRRWLYVLSVGLSLSLFPILVYAKHKLQAPVYVYMLCYLFAYMGGKQITRLLPTEIFPAVTRDLGVASCDFMETLLSLLEKFSTYGGKQTWYYAAISSARWVFVPLGLIFTLFFMPETKDLTLAETEELGGDLNVSTIFGPPTDEEMQAE